MVDQNGNPTAKAAWKLSDHKRFFKYLRQHARFDVDAARKCLFSGVVFPIGFKPALVFGTVKAIPLADFSNCVFANTAKFEKAVFADVALFVGAVFEGVANFRSSEFKEQAAFENVVFKKKADFNYADFLYDARFEHADFKNAAFFESTSFGSWAKFSDVTFHGASSFNFASFNNGVFFMSAKFHGRTSFEVRTEQNRQWSIQRGFANGDDRNERQDRNFPQIDFEGACFDDMVDFSNRHFLEATSFSGVTFKVVPQFHNCVLHQDTDFTKTEFKDTESNHAARAYRTLKLAMGDVRARDDEAMFYAKEQESLRRRQDTRLSIKIMSWIYMVLSDYGRSYVRPLVILVLVTVGFSLVYWFWELRLNNTQDPSGTFAFTMKQIVRPFLIWTSTGLAQSEPVAIVAESPLVLRFVATIQSVANIGLITLFLLALRRQFSLH